MQKIVLLTASEHELALNDLSILRSKIERLEDKIEDDALKALLYSMKMCVTDVEGILNGV